MNYNHIIKRARERYDLRLSTRDVDEISRMIREGAPGARLVNPRPSEGHPHDQNWNVEFKGQVLRVAYNSARGEAFTLRPRHMDAGSMKLKDAVRIVRRKP